MAGKKKLLFIDDNPSIIETSRFILEDMGFEVISASNGSEAIEKVGSGLPDLIILDLTLPDMSGFEVCKTLREKPETKNTPILLLTGMDKSEVVEKGNSAGITDYLTKPLDWSAFEQTISRFIKS